MSEFFIVNPLPPEQIHHEFNIYISNIYSERETRIMARRFEVEKGEEEEEKENERFAKEGGYNQTGFNFTVERNFYWDRRSRRQPETEKDGRKSVGKLGRESTLVAIRGTTFPLSLIRASSCTLCINLPPRAPPSSSVSYRCYTRFQLPFSAETRFLHDFRPTERINTVELNPRIGVD